MAYPPTIVDPDKIPATLRELDDWLVWKYKPNPRNPAKKLKVPYYVGGGKRFGDTSADRDRMAPFDEALKYASKSGFDGVGLALFAEQNHTFVDLDACVDDNGKLSPFARKLVKTGAYVEKSPSGRGLRAVFSGALVEGKRNFYIENDQQERERVEVYCSGAYNTFTGDAVLRGGEPGHVVRMPNTMRIMLLEGMSKSGSVGGGGGGGLTGGNSLPGVTPISHRPLRNFTPEDLRRILAALPDEWGEAETGKWWQVVAAAKMQFSDDAEAAEEAYEVIDEWSQRHSGYDPEGNRQLWDNRRWAHESDNPREAVTTLRSLAGRAYRHKPSAMSATRMREWGVKVQAPAVQDDMESLLRRMREASVGASEEFGEYEGGDLDDVEGITPDKGEGSSVLDYPEAEELSVLDRPAKPKGPSLAKFLALGEKNADFIAKAKQADSKLTHVSFTDLPGLDVPPPGETELVRNWLYGSTVSMINAEGGVGKTYAALHLAIETARGGEWFGETVVQGKTLFLSGEDSAKTIRQRLHGVLASKGIGPEEVMSINENLDIFSFENIAHRTMFTGERADEGEFSEVFELIRFYTIAKNYRYVMMDNLNIFYGANENVKALVNLFMDSWITMCRANDTAVVMLGYPPKSKENDYAGSTAWHSRIRLLIRMGRLSTGKGKNNEEKGGTTPYTEMKVTKSNFGPAGITGYFKWEPKFLCFVPTDYQPNPGVTNAEGASTPNGEDPTVENTRGEDGLTLLQSAVLALLERTSAAAKKTKITKLMPRRVPKPDRHYLKLYVSAPEIEALKNAGWKVSNNAIQRATQFLEKAGYAAVFVDPLTKSNLLAFVRKPDVGESNVLG